MQSYKHGMTSQGPDPELYYVKQNRIGTCSSPFTSKRLLLSPLARSRQSLRCPPRVLG